MNRKLGAPAGAFFGVKVAQSGFESRTSSFMTPLKPGTDDGLADPCCDGCWFEQPANPRHRPTAMPKNGFSLQCVIGMWLASWLFISGLLSYLFEQFTSL